MSVSEAEQGTTATEAAAALVDAWHQEYFEPKLSDVALGELTRRIAALTAAASARWRPIEEAPKDGSEILVCQVSQRTAPCFNVVYFSAELPMHPWAFVDGGGSYSFGWPTHWMPIPSPPETER